MRIGFIGAGKVGFSLGKYLSLHGSDIVGYHSLNPASAQEAAAFAGGTAFESPVALVAASDIAFITVPDGKIASIWQELASAAGAGTLDLAGKTVCHCSGALSSTVFDGIEELGGWGFSIHPLYAVSSKRETYRELDRALFTVEGSAARLDDMVRYHAAAVMASNLVVGLMHAASGELVRCGFAPDAAERALRPLFIGNAQHIVDDGTAQALTGPAERGDTATIQKHLACLDGNHREVYRLLTDELFEVAAIKHGDNR